MFENERPAMYVAATEPAWPQAYGRYKSVGRRKTDGRQTGGVGVKRYGLVLVLVLAMAGFGGLAEAHSGQAVTFFPIQLPGVSRPWTVRKRDPYATWDAKSQIAPSTEVVFEGKDGVVDSAPLMPQALYAVDRDLIEGNRVWLSKNSLLVKMDGGTGNWYCTWRFDEKSTGTKLGSADEHISGFDYVFCLRADENGNSIDAKIMIADFKGLLAITDPESGMGRYRNGVGATNSVVLKPVYNEKFPTRAQLQVLAAWNVSHGGSVCLHMAIAAADTDQKLAQNDQCFSGVGQSLNIAGGTYTVTSIGEHNAFKIRIDSPINVRGLSPRIIK
ncbi:hypothetical protein [Sphingomonas oligophenolica]